MPHSRSNSWRAGILALALASLLTSARCGAEAASVAGTATFLIDGNRIYAELGFVRPDGSLHPALAFVDMGSAAMTLRQPLFHELRLDRHRPLRFKVGNLLIDVPADEVSLEPGAGSPMGPRLRVEAVLPAGILQRYRLEIDYLRRTITLSQHQTQRPEGVPVPFRLDADTGLIAVPTSIDGSAYWITVDSGSAYTWVRARAAQLWLRSHSDWERGRGAVGPSNMMMSGDSTETAGTLLRVPAMSIGPLRLGSVGVLAAGEGHLLPDGTGLFDWYSQKNAVPVLGWIGGNVLQGFRLTIDYPSRISYWLRQKGSEPGVLEQVGITLQYKDHSFVIAGIATQSGRPTVGGILPRDRLIQVDQLDTATATWGQIYEALHGKAGQARRLVLERNGRRFAIEATVTAF